VIALKAGIGDTVYNFINSGQSYGVHTYAGGQFHPDYLPAVGEGFFYLNKGTAPVTWNVTFSVN